MSLLFVQDSKNKVVLFLCIESIKDMQITKKQLFLKIFLFFLKFLYS